MDELQSDMLRIAEVAVYNAAFSFDKPYSYYIPDAFAGKILAGMRVIVPFGQGSRKRTGIVLNVTGMKTQNVSLKPVVSLVDEKPVLNDEMLELVYWLKENTFCTYYDAVRTVLPSGMNVRIKERYELNSDIIYSSLSEEERNIVCFLKNASSRREFDAVLDTHDDHEKELTVRSLIDKNVIKVVADINQKVSDRFISMVRLSDYFLQDPSAFNITDKQKRVVRLLSENGSAAVREVCYICSVTQVVVKNLLKNKVLEEFVSEEFRVPGSKIFEEGALSKIILSDEQKAVFDRVLTHLYERSPKCFLLHGVTGSGKTSVFIKLIEKTLEAGKTAIMLIPEIALTPQIVTQFRRLFGETVAVVHSSLSLGQRLDEYKRIQRKMARIVVGTRSAVFAPLSDIGIIIMDEEGERSYKSDNAPRYSTLAVAKQRCRVHGAVLLLGSATPSVESYYYAKKGIYELLELKNRYNSSELPDVHIVDMGLERNNGNHSEFSEVLIDEINYNILHKEQTILLLNRRGYHTVITCTQCGEPLHCPNCSIPYTYHKANNSLVCHYCGSTAEPVSVCPSCGCRIFRPTGFGTQKMEEQLSELFGSARILRMDADTTFSRYAYEQKFAAFARGEYDIMIGTQMIGKGLDFPDVTLVGVLSVDKSLYSGDFRSYERTFSLITQVVGRSGRGNKKGRAYLQTFIPDHYVLNMAANQDYEAFYNEEIAMRRALIFPPLCDICVIGISSASDVKAHNAADTTLDIIKDIVNKSKVSFPLRVLGPVRSSAAKVNGKYRYRIILKCKNNNMVRMFLRDVLIRTSGFREFANVNIYADINGEIV
ncbi:MAG: primosomal protein N' [Oscillospiraceae bacterium]|nr:primosomal protein N' [Oscillospiraceae bacterium]